MTIPCLWLVSDARTDAVLESALQRLPRGAGLVFRHYHLPAPDRAARFRVLARLCRRRGLVAVWAGAPRTARALGADGCYGPPELLASGPDLLRLVTVHSLRELAAAQRARADAVLVSPVFPTRSHPGAPGLGPLRWLAIARASTVPAIALGGMTRLRARRLPSHGWAAIDGLASAVRRP
ncbi:thiamine phosphate synthase [Novosphingobium piscinae]|uniref:thiamine phosphate synthase n=1 Tax=Novosphingobium piscinae TaxID=1507448 RepID=UPI0031B580F7